MKVYADTSVFGGVYDEEFAAASSEFFAEVRAGRFKLVVSAVVQAEIASAPENVQALFADLVGQAEIADLTEKVLALRDAYVSEGVVTSKSIDDAAHVALATITNCRMIVSWNFKHIVHFEKIPKYNAVNALKGYHAIDIFSPSEVIAYDDS
jgi:predicted nucleic acid-binding protein